MLLVYKYLLEENWVQPERQQEAAGGPPLGLDSCFVLADEKSHRKSCT